jgi:hypothetical protein
MYLTSFLVSYYLNDMTESSQRATVLSFKGLCYNLAYGGIGLLYALVVAMMRDSVQTPAAGFSLEDMVFRSTFIGFPVGFSIVLGAWILWAVRHSGKAKGGGLHQRGRRAMPVRSRFVFCTLPIRAYGFSNPTE